MLIRKFNYCMDKSVELYEKISEDSSILLNLVVRQDRLFQSTLLDGILGVICVK